MKNVQISQELFMKLLRYHLLDDDSCTEDVKNGLEQKMNTMVERELYTKSKTAPTEEEREQSSAGVSGQAGNTGELSMVILF